MLLASQPLALLKEASPSLCSPTNNVVLTIKLRKFIEKHQVQYTGKLEQKYIYIYLN